MKQKENAVIAIADNRLAIFGSTLGFAGPVIQDYTKFDNEADAIEDARRRMSALNITCDERIIRPFIKRATWRRIT